MCEFCRLILLGFNNRKLCHGNKNCNLLSELKLHIYNDFIEQNYCIKLLVIYDLNELQVLMSVLWFLLAILILIFYRNLPELQKLLLKEDQVNMLHK